MRKKVLIMQKTRWIMRKIFSSLRSPKITSFHAAEIELSPKVRVYSQAHFKQKKYIGIWAFPVIFICIWYVMKLSYQLGLNYVMFNENNTTVILLAEVDFLLMHKQYNSRCYVIYYNIVR